jgi:hypothetical protein
MDIAAAVAVAAAAASCNDLNDNNNGPAVDNQENTPPLASPPMENVQIINNG